MVLSACLHDGFISRVLVGATGLLAASYVSFEEQGLSILTAEQLSRDLFL